MRTTSTSGTATAPARWGEGAEVEVTDGQAVGARGRIVAPAGWDLVPGVAVMVVEIEGERRAIREDFLRRVR